MHYTKSTIEACVLTSSKMNILDLSARFLKKILSELTVYDIKQKIMEREQIGDTFVGNGTILLHVISKNIKQEIGLYLFLQKQIAWHSVYSDRDYQINRVIVLCVNPYYSLHHFKHLNWAIENQFMRNVRQWQKEELCYL